MPTGSWPLVEELFARGDAAFIAELRSIHDPERLGKFAKRWYEDKRPAARQFLFDYLDQPLNCYRHEPLVKRLFKLAEAAGDDELMGMFLVAFDRTLRRLHVRKTNHEWKHQSFPTMAAAQAAQREWLAEGFEANPIHEYSRQFYATARKSKEVVRTPMIKPMPRPPEKQRKRSEALNDWQRQRFEKRYLLFSLPTRRYLRRRTWRYFRKIGNTDPERYLKAASRFLLRYKDEDVDSEIQLLGNWGLVHALFYDCPALVPKAKGWEFQPGKGVGDLVAAPRFAAAWLKHPAVAFDLMLKAQCFTVRRWAMELLKRYSAAWLDTRPVGDWLTLIDHADPDISAFGFERLEKVSNVETVPVEEWLKRLDGDNLTKLTVLADFLKRKLDPSRVSREVALQLAVHRVKPVAEFGFELVKTKEWQDVDDETLITLIQAENDSLRAEIIAWFQEGRLPRFEQRINWYREWFDSQYRDVRDAGWRWLIAWNVDEEEAERLCAFWAESPYDDIRFRALDEIGRHNLEANPESRLALWASVLTNIVRGGRQKPGVVAKVVERIQRSQPEEAAKLFPLLVVAVRSLRGPEFRAGLSGLVQLWKTSPELQPRLREQFPEFSLGG